MSADRFDDLSKALATGTSRRRVLKAVAATIAGGAVAVFLGSRQEAEAAPCPNNRKKCGPVCCPNGWKCCQGGQGARCVPNGQNC
jgi:hypothetical protein